MNAFRQIVSEFLKGLLHIGRVVNLVKQQNEVHCIEHQFDYFAILHPFDILSYGLSIV